ncbi:MAG: hypothetical protein HGB06_09125 [Chlorobaculum sp.]|jgi:predicted enzyme involved in methoxymalonyl-ACP biosynthesis|nr:hypothetical protein [Chlorobaculum sp.]
MDKNLYEMEPSSDANLSEWRTWAYRLKRRAIAAEAQKNELKSKIKSIKQDVENKEKSVKKYKLANLDLENTIKNIKINPCYKICKFIASIRGRFLDLLKKNQNLKKWFFAEFRGECFLGLRHRSIAMLSLPQ